MGLTITIHQPDHLPWLGLMNKVDQADLFVVLDCVQYSRSAFQHRNRVIGFGAEPTWLTVPLVHADGDECLLSNIRIKNELPWQAKYRNIFYERYHRHPHWDAHADFVRELTDRPFATLIELNMYALTYLFRSLGISTPIVMASSLRPQGSKSELNFDICQKLGASRYIAGPSSKLYLDRTLFDGAGIAVSFHEFHHPAYPQFERETFTSHLSVLDLLLNQDRDSIAFIRNDPVQTS